MNDWFSILFHFNFYINNSSFSHLVFHNLLTKNILFQHMYLCSNQVSLSGQELLQQNNILSKNKSHSEITKFLCFFFINSKNSFSAFNSFSWFDHISGQVNQG